jgi:tetratricopeptide (TPR) repeat protein
LHKVRLLAVALVYQGEIDAGRALAEQGLAEVRNLQMPGLEARLLNLLSIAAGRQGDLAGNLHLDQQALQACRQAGDRINEAIGLSNLGVAWLQRGALERSREALEPALMLLRANGDRAVEGIALCNLSRLALYQGDATRSQALARTALEIATAAQARHNAATAGFCLGDAELALGHVPAARQAFADARALALQTGMPHQHDASAGLARAALAEGDTRAALAAVLPVLDHVAAGGTLAATNDARLIELTCHQALARAGDPRAADWLLRAHAALMAEADALGDSALRLGFLHDIPHHRQIVAAWAARAAVPPAGAVSAEGPGP